MTFLDVYFLTDYCLNFKLFEDKPTNSPNYPTKHESICFCSPVNRKKDIFCAQKWKLEMKCYFYSCEPSKWKQKWNKIKFSNFHNFTILNIFWQMNFTFNKFFIWTHEWKKIEMKFNKNMIGMTESGTIDFEHFIAVELRWICFIKRRLCWIWKVFQTFLELLLTHCALRWAK